MDILIKNMEMPKSCDECELLYDFVYCIVTKQKMLDADFEKRNPSCPLIPVPEHGDLIDRDAVLNELKKYYKVGEIAEVGEVACFISDAEVVLERTT